MRSSRLLFCFAITLVAMALPTLAADSGKVTVTILDETGAPFPGVVVTLANTKNLAPSKALSTSAEGKAVFGVVQAGSGYMVTIEVAGYQKIEEANISVGINANLNLLYKLQQQKTEKVVVQGARPVASIDEPTGTVTISGEFFQDLPILGRNYQSALTLAPGVNDANGDGNPNVHGARERDFKASLDGISNVDPLTGTFMSNINPDAIEEIEVVTTGADASYGRAVGGFANIITKQGSNDFEGVVKMIYRTSALDGNGAGSGPIPKFDWYQPSVSLTGKIIRDKLFFAVNHEYHDVGEPIILVGGGTIVRTLNFWRHLDKITWQASPRNKVNFQYSADPFQLSPFGVGGNTSIDSGYGYKQGGPTYSVEWQNPISPNFTVKSIVGYSDTGIDLLPLTEGIKNRAYVDPFGTCRPGIKPPDCTPSSSANHRPGLPLDEDYVLDLDNGGFAGSFYLKHTDVRQRLTFKSDATMYVNSFLGKEHTFEFGFIAEDEHSDSTETVHPFSLFETLGTSVAADQTPMQQAILFRTIFSPGAPESSLNSADGLTAGIYLQDTFRPHPNVNIKAGLRYEWEHVTAPGKVNVDPGRELSAFNRAYKICNPSGDPGTIDNTCTKLTLANFTVFEGLPKLCSSSDLSTSAGVCTFLQNGLPLRGDQRTRITNKNLGPRLSVQWDPKGDGKTRLFGTYSKIFDKVFLAVPEFEQGPYSFSFAYLLHQNDNSNNRWEPDRSPLQISAPNVSQLTTNLRTPYLNEVTLGISREIAPETGLTLTYIKRNYKDLFQDTDINHYAQDLGDNRLPCKLQGGIYYPQGKPDGQFDDCTGNPRTGRADGIPDLKVRNPFFNQIFEVGNLNSTDYTAFQLELVRRLHHNWQLEASYIWSKAIGQAEDYLQVAGDDPTTVQDEKGYLGYDQRHIVRVNATTHLPVWGLRLGTVARWESGLPYSIIAIIESEDQPSGYGFQHRAQYDQTRTIFPTHQRNDQRNQGYYSFDVNLQRDFQVGKANITAGAEILNLLNDDSLYIASITNSRLGRNFDGEGSFRRFGRRFQMTAKVNF